MNNGTQANDPTATATAEVTNNQVTAVKMDNHGFGYTSVPTVILQGGGGTGARAKAEVTDQKVSAVTVTSHGRNYQSQPEVIILMDGGASLLTYAMLPIPDPLQVPEKTSQTSQLSLSVTNSGQHIVTCSKIIVTFPLPDQTPSALTNSFDGVGVVVPVDDNNKPLWKSDAVGNVFTLSPVTEAASKIAGNAVVFTFDNIHVNNSPGTCEINISDITSTSTLPAGTRDFPIIKLNKWPAQFSMTDLIADPLEVNSGGSTQLDWTVKGPDVTSELVFDRDGKGNPGIISVGNSGPYPAENLTNPRGVNFTLQAKLTVPGQPSPLKYQKQRYVDVIPKEPKVKFWIEANPITLGEYLKFTLHWEAENVSDFQITANDGPDGNTVRLNVPFTLAGKFVVTPHRLTTTYVFEVLGPNVQSEHQGDN